MGKYQDLELRYYSANDSEVHATMNSLATHPWSPKGTDPHDHAPDPGWYYFHRDGSDGLPPCTLCMFRKGAAHLVVSNIIPDQVSDSLSITDYNRIVKDFCDHIAEPAMNKHGGIVMPGMDQFRLEDYFTQKAVDALKRFCNTSNQSNGGSHDLDQQKWISFLLIAYDDGKDVHCDTFGKCLKASDLWPEEYVDPLIHEYDFAMRLLRQAGR